MSGFSIPKDVKKMLTKLKIKQLKLFCEKYNNHVMIKDYKKMGTQELINIIRHKVYDEKEDEIDGIEFDVINGTAKPLIK